VSRLSSADTDLIFQSDIFDVLHAFVRSKHELHMVSESPAERNDGYTARRLRDYPLCHAPLKRHLVNNSILPADAWPALVATASPARGGGRRLKQRGGGSKAAATAPSGTPGESDAVTAFWKDFGGTHRLNFGSMFGTTSAMVALCEQVVDVLVGPMAACWDQGMLNVLVWTGLVGAASSYPKAASADSVPHLALIRGGGVPPAISSHHHGMRGGAGRRSVTRVVVWDCFDGPVRTLDVGSLRDAHGRFYTELGSLHPIVHQFRPTRQSAFVASLQRIFPTRRIDEDASYHAVAWQARLFEHPLQRVPFVWNDRRRMDKIDQQMRASGLGNPADSKRSLPAPLPPCTKTSTMYRACAHRDELGAVHGSAWEKMAQDGFVLAVPTPLRLSEPSH
jgi:hypothetical protein